MAATTMHFGPEWMRKPVSRPQQPSPPPTSQSALSTYSALVSTTPGIENDKQDDAHPFRYTKEELLRIYKESPKAGLGLEVERWEGVVREISIDPVALREMSDGEKKLFSGPLNSELRRRQSTDYLSPLNTSLGTDRPRLSHSASATGSPLRERYPGIKRRDSNADSPTVPMARKQSLSSLHSPSVASRGTAALPSPRKGPGFPSFDGVLSSGETWTVRRRTSEASLKAGGAARDAGGETEDKPDAIPEDATNEQGDHARSNSLSKEGQAGPNVENANNSANNPSNGTQQAPATAAGGTSAQDLGAVEWSYKDPSGNIQGPFRADLMQKWYDDGYFTMDLPMKRTQLDTLWMTLAELIKRATVPDKAFLCAILPPPAPPPGLGRRIDSPLQIAGLTQNDHQAFSNPYQPSPIRTLRSSTLESINGSNSADSPLSALGHFGNNSPDSLAFANRLNPGYAEPHLGFSGGLDMTSPLRQRHVADLQDSPHRLHSPSYNALLGQGMGYDSYGQYPGFNHVQSSPWGTPSQAYTNYNQNIGYSNNYGPASAGYGIPQHHAQINPQLYGNNDLAHQQHQQQVQNQGYFDPIPVVNGILNEPDTIPSPQTSEQYHSEPFAEAKPDNTFPQLQDSAPVASPSLVRAQSGWDASNASPAQRTIPAFDTPTTLNTLVPAVPSKPSPWGQPIESPATLPSVQESSAWPPPAQAATDATWPSSTSTETTAPSTLQTEQPSQHQAADMALAVDTAKTAGPEPVVSLKGKKAKKAAAAAAAAAAAVAVTPEPTVESTSRGETPSPSSSQQTKAPWAQADKKKAKTPTTISLREIQENEAKLAEARKDKERARMSASIATSAVEGKEDVQPFTASWGLPTSQAGSRTGAPAKDASAVVSPTASSPAPAVWTNATKSATSKKTMKEIQEEEEKRKKVAVKETVVAAPAKRGYADQATKVSAAPSPVATTSAGGAWVTVGTKPAVATPAARPTSTTVSSVPATTSKAPVLTTTRSAASVARPAASSSAKVEDFPITPSHEFLKWLSESLKGLKSGVNVEEIIAMLLSFSLDPDPITVEIISDTIYASSTTLDGRRFAAEFVAKRKADSANRAKGTTSGKVPAKPISIAEVVKATPKTQQPEWGFKVVKTKKKGSRS
ncbi:hypothetical protein BKA70DRAFT_311024 [Coprinopsis sp. MPI-PUGE-AT-0042]|nr:hypothetical protein BKA70DRAFT_311024 [Coprinopsis sp. MPI-PUGE-AT-0042]